MSDPQPSRFRGQDYHQFRPTYPESLFSAVKSSLQPGLKPGPLQVLDLGAGTGYSSESFLKIAPRAQMTLVDLEPGMLEQARRHLPEAKIIEGRAEAIPVEAKHFDLVMVASAWHWMHAEKTITEIDRVLAADGAVFIFEYQFPKAQPAPALNEWVRRQFNLHWKAPSQTPRGSLKEITQCWRDDVRFSQVGAVETTETRTHTREEFAGAIYSQSRFLHYEESLDPKDAENYRLKIRNELAVHWDRQEVLPFSYCYEGFAFRKRA